MKKLNYQGYTEHIEEHNMMLKKLIQMDHKINDNDWSQTEIQEFIEDWKKHIIQTDMPFNTFIKQQSIKS